MEYSGIEPESNISAQFRVIGDHDSGRIRTYDQRIRSAMLYSTELLSHRDPHIIRYVGWSVKCESSDWIVGQEAI